MASLLTNESSMVALTTLRQINRNMTIVQQEISTGKSVSNARDNAAIWAVSTVMQADVDSFSAISDSLNLGAATVAVARGAAEQVTSVLQEMKELIVAAQEDNVDRDKIQTDVANLRDQINSIVGAAQFNGLNLLDGSTATVDFLSSLNRDSAGVVTAANITVTAQDLSTGGTFGTLLASVDVSTAAAATTALNDIETLVDTGIDAAAAFGSAQKRIDIQNEFITTLTDSMKIGIGALTDADMEEASARLQSLQVQQQLGVQALSIANSRPQVLLGLFQ
ncbi:MAG: flagellin [Marinicaulis sp.]|nr:hypothetical protein [Marinicaulis sp.]NNE41848.1 flagellin [Marinicaulis sp.]